MTRPASPDARSDPTTATKELKAFALQGGALVCGVADAQAFTAEAWVSVSGYNWATEGTWIPRVMVRRQSDEAPLASTFVAVIEPYDRNSKLGQIRRLQLPGGNVAIEIQLVDGRRDLFVAVVVE